MLHVSVSLKIIFNISLQGQANSSVLLQSHPKNHYVMKNYVITKNDNIETPKIDLELAFEIDSRLGSNLPTVMKVVIT